LVRGFLEVLLQGRTAAEGSRPGAGADAQAIVGNAVEIDQILFAQHGHGVGQQLVQQVEVLDAEVGQGVVVDRDATDQPAESVVVGTQPGQGAGTADAFEGGVQPQRRAKAGVDGSASGSAFTGAEVVVKRGQVQAKAEVPDDTRLVILLKEILQGEGREDLLPISSAQPRRGSVGR